LTRSKSNDYLLAGVRLAESRSLQKAGDIALRSESAQDFLKRSEARRKPSTSELEKSAAGYAWRIYWGNGDSIIDSFVGCGVAFRQWVEAENAKMAAVNALGNPKLKRALSESRRATAESVTTAESAKATASQATGLLPAELASLARLESDHSRLSAVNRSYQSSNHPSTWALLVTLQQATPGRLPAQRLSYILNLVFGPGSKFALIGCHDFKSSRGCAGPEMLAYDGQTGRPFGPPVKEFPTADDDIYLAFNPEGTLLASVGYNEAILFQPETGQVLDRIPSTEFDGQRDRLSISPDGGSFMIDHPEGIPLNWRYTGLWPGILAIPGDEFAMDPDQQALYDLTNRGLLGQPILSDGVPFQAMRFKGQELKGVVEQEGSKILWDVATNGPASTPVSSVNPEVSLSQDLQSVAIFNSQDGISLWDPESADPQAVQISKEWKPDDFSYISRLALSPGGERLVVGYTGFHRDLPYDIAYGVRVQALRQTIGEYERLKPALCPQQFADLEFT
jgi:hypothetical protein